MAVEITDLVINLLLMNRLQSMGFISGFDSWLNEMKRHTDFMHAYENQGTLFQLRTSKGYLTKTTDKYYQGTLYKLKTSKAYLTKTTDKYQQR